MDDYESLSHSRWECKYHVVFILVPARQDSKLGFGHLGLPGIKC